MSALNQPKNHAVKECMLSINPQLLVSNNAILDYVMKHIVGGAGSSYVIAQHIHDCSMLFDHILATEL